MHVSHKEVLHMGNRKLRFEQNAQGNLNIIRGSE